MRQLPLDNKTKGKHLRAVRPDGGVVTQWIANPCTPVRFRVGPPDIIRQTDYSFFYTEFAFSDAGLVLLYGQSLFFANHNP